MAYVIVNKNVFLFQSLDSVFELVSGEDKARMEAAKMQADLLQKQKDTPVPKQCDALSYPSKEPLSGKQPAVDCNTRDTQTPTTSAEPAMCPMLMPSGGFTPFVRIPAKQKRYEQYLEAMRTGKPCESTY